MTERLGSLPFEKRAELFKGAFQAAGLAVGGDDGQLLQQWGATVSKFSKPGFTPTPEDIDKKDKVVAQLEVVMETKKPVREAALSVVNAGMGLGMNFV